MPLAGFEPTIPVFKRAKAFYALDRAATVIGRSSFYLMGNIDFVRNKYGLAHVS
jgi:hypothetical protein